MFIVKCFALGTLIVGTSLFAEDKSSPSERNNDTAENSKESRSRDQESEDRARDRENDRVRVDSEARADIDRCF